MIIPEGHKRLFTGIPIENKYFLELVETELHSINNPLFRWTKIQNLHFTLLFIGNVPNENINNIINAMQFLYDEKKFSLLSDIICYAPTKKPRMIWLQAKPNYNFLQIQRNLYQQIKPLHKELQPPKPKIHITLARFNKKIKHYSLQELPRISPTKFPANKVILWQTVPTNQGIIYKPLQEFPLK